MSDGIQFPDIASCWRDTEGEDGVIVVVGREKGYAVAAGDALDGEVLIQPGHFGHRYVRATSEELR